MTRKYFEFDQYDRIDGLMISAELVIFGIVGGRLHVLMAGRDDFPKAGIPALPGRYLQEGFTLQMTARRIAGWLGLSTIALEEIGTFSEPERDPRKRAVSAVFVGVVTEDVLRRTEEEIENAILLEIRTEPQFMSDDKASFFYDVRAFDIAFDHDQIILAAIKHLQRTISWSLSGFRFLPPRFTLGNLQQVHEAVLGMELEKTPFRKRMIGRIFDDGTRLRRTGELVGSGMGRPAELYERVPAR